MHLLINVAQKLIKHRYSKRNWKIVTCWRVRNWSLRAPSSLVRLIVRNELKLKIHSYFHNNWFVADVPKPLVKWFRDDKILRDSDFSTEVSFQQPFKDLKHFEFEETFWVKVWNLQNRSLQYDNGVCTLSIAAVKPCHAGVYKCIVKNISGTSISECEVRVRRKFWFLS